MNIFANCCSNTFSSIVFCFVSLSLAAVFCRKVPFDFVMRHFAVRIAELDEVASTLNCLRKWELLFYATNTIRINKAMCMQTFARLLFVYILARKALSYRLRYGLWSLECSLSFRRASQSKSISKYWSVHEAYEPLCPWMLPQNVGYVNFIVIKRLTKKRLFLLRTPASVPPLKWHTHCECPMSIYGRC